MKITVITVAYNSAATILDTISAVGRQRHADIEHIIIDGGSNDGTQGLIRKHGTHVAKFISEPDRGIYDAMNKGLAMATGDFVGFLNADDVLASEHVLDWIAEAAQGPAAADIIYGDLVYVQQNDLSRILRYWRSGPYSRRALRLGWMPPHPTLYLRRSLLASIGYFDVGYKIAADYEFILRCFNRKDVSIIYINRVMVRMRTGGASNKSLRAIARKSREDLLALERTGTGGWFTLFCKNARKIPQFFSKPPLRQVEGP